LITIAGIWSKAKPSFSLKSVTHKYGHIGSSISNIDRLPQIMKAVDHRASASLAENQLEDDDIVELELDTEPSETEALPHEFNLPLMADLFDNLQDKTDLVGGNSRNATLIILTCVYFFSV
jgi:hypothetical protein